MAISPCSSPALDRRHSINCAAKRGGAKLNAEHSDDSGVSDDWISSASVSDSSGSPAKSVTATIDDTQATDGKLFVRLRAENP